MKNILHCSAVLLVIMNIFSCNPIKKQKPEEQENITSVILTLLDTTTQKAITCSFRDPDGVGGNDPIQLDTLTMDNNVVYRMSIQVFNEKANPSIDLTPEILAKGTEHQFFFASTINDVLYQYLDADSLGNPIGIQGLLQTGNIGSGTFSVILKHQPSSKAPSPGNIQLGETDIELIFKLNVQ